MLKGLLRRFQQVLHSNDELLFQITSRGNTKKISQHNRVIECDDFATRKNKKANKRDVMKKK